MMDRQKKVPKRRFQAFKDAEAWEERKLGEVAVLYQPETITGNELCKTGIPVFGANGYIGFYTKANHMSDQVTISARGEGTGTPNYVKAPVWITGNSMVVNVDDKEIDKWFLYSTFSSKSLKKFVTGGAQPQLTREILNQVALLFPTHFEQTAIGTFFSTLDRLIARHQRKLDKLKQVKQAYLSELFPADGEREPKRRFPGFTGPWEERKLSDLTSMNARIGWQNLRTSEFLDSGDYLLITGTDFNDGEINYENCHYVEKERYEQDKKIQIRNGSILITKDGTLGKVAYVQGLSIPATLNAGVFNVEIKDTRVVDEKYLFQYLKAPFLMDYVSGRATGGTIKHLNQSILVDFPVVIPKKTEQQQIGSFFSTLDRLITLQQRKLDKLAALKTAYLNELFDGSWCEIGTT